MKKTYYLLVVLLGLFAFSSCTDTIDPQIDSTMYKAPIFDALLPGSPLVLTKANAAQVAKTFAWTRADFGFQSATTYVLQIDKAGNQFKAPLDLAMTTQLTVPFTVAELNTKLLALGLPFGKASTIEARVTATVSPLVNTLYSPTMTMTVTPYEVVIIYPTIYVPGSYQAASGYTSDWSPDKAPALYSLKSDNKYEGYVYIAADGSMFKFTKDQNWTTNWGDDGLDLKLDPNGKDIPTSAGYYKMNVNLNTLTYSTLKTVWGVIGDATPTGWDSDTKMVYDKVAKTWSVNLALKVGSIKFRANSDWALNYGDKDANLTLEEGSDNIPVTAAGNYTITLDFNRAVYTYNLKKN
jgi:hypothetical protein